MWGDDPPSVRGLALQVLVSRLRTLLLALPVSREECCFGLNLDREAFVSLFLVFILSYAAH